MRRSRLRASALRSTFDGKTYDFENTAVLGRLGFSFFSKRELSFLCAGAVDSRALSFLNLPLPCMSFDFFAWVRLFRATGIFATCLCTLAEPCRDSMGHLIRLSGPQIIAVPRQGTSSKPQRCQSYTNPLAFTACRQSADQTCRCKVIRPTHCGHSVLLSLSASL